MTKGRFMTTSVVLIVLALALGLVSLTVADVPQLINYQGRLLDAYGEPAEDTYDITFHIYSMAEGGIPLWSETHSSVKVRQGLFSITLGSVTPFEDLFNGAQYWLGVEVGGVESLGRTPLITVPYALRSAVADSVPKPDWEFVQSAGDTMTGSLAFEAGNNDTPEARIRLGATYANLEFKDGDTLTTRIYGQNFGGAYFYHQDNGNNRIRMDAESDGGIIILRDSDEEDRITLDAGLNGTSAVDLPARAIDSYEILDEPGLARDKDTWFIELPDTNPTTIVNAWLRAPAEGYVLAVGRGFMWMTGEQHGPLRLALSSSNDGWPGVYHEMRMGVRNEPNRGYDMTRYDAFSLERVWQVDSGQILNCFLRGKRENMNADLVAIHNGSVTLIYLPTSYGDVSTWVTADEADNFQRVEARDVGDPFDPAARTETAYKVDLRELEIRALRKRLEAEKAERDLERARRMNERRRE